MAVGDGAKLGYESWWGLKEETSWATKVTATSFIEILSESLGRERESKILTDEINTSRNPTRRFLLNELVQGGMECYLNVASDGVVKLIKNGRNGTVTSSGDANTGYTHILYEGSLAASLSSLTIQKS